MMVDGVNAEHVNADIDFKGLRSLVLSCNKLFIMRYVIVVGV